MYNPKSQIPIGLRGLYSLSSVHPLTPSVDPQFRAAKTSGGAAEEGSPYQDGGKEVNVACTGQTNKITKYTNNDDRVTDICGL